MRVNKLLKESDGKVVVEYNGSCVKNNIPALNDATFMSNVIDQSELLKTHYLDNTNISEVAPKSVQKFLSGGKKCVIGYHKNLIWIFFSHVDKHFFFTADDYLKIGNEYHETADLDRGN